MTRWNQKFAGFALAATLLTALTGCRGESVGTPEPTVPAPLEPPVTQQRVEENGVASVDHSHVSEGYLLAHRGETEKRLKLRISKETEYTYDLPEKEWTAFPLSEGDGEYTVTVFEQVEGTTYIPCLTTVFDAELDSAFAPFLRPNQQVNYATAPQTLSKAVELTAGCDGDGEKVEKIYAFVSQTLTYDEKQAEDIQSGYIPDLDEVLQKEKGICLDFAALMTAMARSQGIPCRLVVGDAGSVYHAWAEVWDEDRADWVRYDPTFAASGKDVSGVKYAPQFYY